MKFALAVGSIFFMAYGVVMKRIITKRDWTKLSFLRMGKVQIKVHESDQARIW